MTVYGFVIARIYCPSWCSVMISCKLYYNFFPSCSFCRSEFLHLKIIHSQQTSKNPDHQEAWQRVREEDYVESREEGTDKVLREPYVFMDAGPYLNQRFGADCRYFILPSPNFPSMSAFAVKKGSPLTPILNNM